MYNIIPWNCTTQLVYALLQSCGPLRGPDRDRSAEEVGSGDDPSALDLEQHGERVSEHYNLHETLVNAIQRIYQVLKYTRTTKLVQAEVVQPKWQRGGARIA